MSLFQMVVEDASSPFHPFRDFNRRLGLSVSPLQSFSPTMDPPFSSFTDEVRARLSQSLETQGMTSFIEGGSSSPGSPQGSPVPPSQQTSAVRASPIIPRARPEDYDSTLEDWWSDGEAERPNPPAKNAWVIIGDSEEENGSGSSTSSSGDASLRSACAVSPQPSPDPFQHWEPELHELDIDWGNEVFSEKEKSDMRRRQNRLACVGLVSTISAEEVDWVMRYYGQEGIFAKPLEQMRPHIFNYGAEFRIPRMVLTPKLVALGVGAPLHPYFRAISDWYEIAPIQLSPNGYKMAIALHMMYTSCGFDPPTMQDLSYFFSLRQSGLGWYYLVVWRSHNKRDLSEGKTSHVKRWKEPFFYVYDTARARLRFNMTPG